MRRVKGFTLIELLIVLLIISIVTSVALLNFSTNDQRQMQIFVDNLSQMLSLAEDRAMFESKVIGLSIDEHEFYFVTLENETQSPKKLLWNVMEDHGLNKHRIPNHLEVKVQVANNKADEEINHNEKEEDEENENEASIHDPQILIFKNRDLTPFILYIGKKDAKASYAIYGKANGSIFSKALKG